MTNVQYWLSERQLGLSEKMEKHFMTNTINVSLEAFNEISSLLDTRAKLITERKEQVARMARTGATLDMKVAASTKYAKELTALNAKLDGLQGKTIVAA